MSERYSTPLASPLYPAPPYFYENAEIFLALFYPKEGVLEKLIPAPMKPPQMPLAGLMFGKQPCKQTGMFMESAVLVQCMFDNPDTGEEEVGVHFSHNYVDTDVALVSGREIWGYPRKLADISMEWKGDTLTAETKRDDTVLLRAECLFDDEGAWIDSGPNINVKLIPSVTGDGHDIAVLNAAHLAYDIKEGRSGEVNLVINSGPQDNLEMVEIESTMIGLFFDCDITVPVGKAIAKLE